MDPKRKTVDIHVAGPEPREQATSDDVIRWLDEEAERVQDMPSRQQARESRGGSPELLQKKLGQTSKTASSGPPMNVRGEPKAAHN